MSLVPKERKTEQQTRIYAHSFEGNREWVVYLRSVSLTSFNKFDDWLYSDRDTSTALVWVSLRSCTAKHDWLEIVSIDQHISRPSNLFRMMRWANTTILSDLRCRNVYETIRLFSNLTLLYLLTQILRELQYFQELLTFVMWFSMNMFLDFDDLTCLSLTVKRYEKNSWTLWTREIKKIIFNWMSFCSAMNRQLTTLIAWMSCERVCIYSHEVLKIVKKLFMHWSSLHSILS